MEEKAVWWKDPDDHHLCLDRDKKSKPKSAGLLTNAPTRKASSESVTRIDWKTRFHLPARSN